MNVTPTLLTDARRRLAATLADDLRPLAERLTVAADEADAPADARDCLGNVGRAAARLAQLIAELAPPAVSDCEIDAFLSAVRHNLKTPVGQIVGYAELILDEPGDWRERHAAELERMRSAGQRLKSLIENILDPPHEGEPVPTEPAEAPAHVAPVAPDQRGHVLIADDQASNRDLLARWLTRLGHSHAAAENGVQALEILQREAFDVVLLDYQMPELDGRQVLQRLKADERLRHLPVIMISALHELDFVVRCIEMGAEDYLPKPFEPVLLRARIGACLEKKRLRDCEEQHRQQMSDVLHAILPAPIVAELTVRGSVQPRRHDRVAILFADIAGFTSYCEQHTPEEVVGHLRRLVEAFEAAAARHGVQKIKTIGDSFMAAAGLLEDLANPVLPCVLAGLEMTAVARELPPHWEVRVGIHAGSVVAGLLGSRQYLYDLWGAAVNTAARVEANGVPGAVCLSQPAWEQIASVAVGESRGFVDAKGLGRLEVIRFVRFQNEAG